MESDEKKLDSSGRRREESPSPSLPLDSTVHEGRRGAGLPPRRPAGPPAEEDVHPAIGDTLGGYHILGKLGAGGMGQVFRARDSELERDVAVKLLHPALTRQPHAMSRFRREARLLAAVHHPNIATIHGALEDGGVRFLVMELVDGDTLAQKLVTGRLAVPETLDIARQIAAALEAAHRKGVVHRDLKPANVMVSPEGWVKVLDFGLAKVLLEGEGGAVVSEETLVQGVLGTAPYMSPEQVRELEADWRTDVWAFGCVVFEMVTGLRAFVGHTRIDLLRAILQVEPPWRELPPELPAAVAELLRRCLAKDLKRRPPMSDLRAALEEALAGMPVAVKGAPLPPHPRVSGPAEVSPSALGIEAATLGYLDSLGEYTVVEKIAAGGQGEVYRAWDRGRKRDTALKVLRPELTGDAESRRRLHEEARVLTWLRHPNIANLYESGTSGGLDFVVTEYITGTTLASRLVDGPLPEAAVVRLGAQIAAALAEAHEHGILHRDLKTSNVMVTPDGQAKVIDFGLAQMPSQSTGSAAPLSPARLEGPLAYRAPEVVAGGEHDVRSDLYAMGVVLYAMATGERPFSGASAEELAEAILHRPPSPPRQGRPALSPALERLILQCLEKDPGRRPASARELAGELAALFPADLPPSAREVSAAEAAHLAPRRLRERRRGRTALWTALALFLALAAGFAAWRQGSRSSPLAAVDSVVVMPSRLVGTGQAAYLPDAIAQTLAGDLAQLAGLDAKMPPSTFDVARLGGDLGRVADAYGAEAMVVSIASLAGGRLALDLQLVEAKSRNLLWSRQYQGAAGAQLELARRAGGELRQALRPDSPTLPAARALGPEAERLVQQGLYFGNLYRNRGQVDDQKRALAAFEKALALAPGRADLAGEMAMLHALSLDFGVSILEVQPEIRRWAERALTLDPRCSKAWAALAYLEGGRQKEGYRRQLEYLLKAASYDPADAYAANRLSGPLAKISYRLALESSRHASETDPLVLTSQIFEAICLMPLGRHDEALARLDQTLALEPGMPFGLLIKGFVLGLAGRQREGLALVKDKLEPFAAEGKLHPGWVALARDLSTFAQASQQGDTATADAAAKRLLAAARGETPFPRWEMTTTEVAGHLARWGRKEGALELLLLRGRLDLVQPYDYLLLSPNLAPLRDDPRFRDDPRWREVLLAARTHFEENLAILEDARAKGELPAYLEQPLADLLKSLRQAQQAPPKT